MSRRPETGANTTLVRKAVNSRKNGVSYDGDIWAGIVTYFTTKHEITEYDFNRIICLSFSLWGSRCHINAVSRSSKERELSVANGDKWCYRVSSLGMLDSIMSWKEFVKRVDSAIRYIKPKLKDFNKLWRCTKGFVSKAKMREKAPPVAQTYDLLFANSEQGEPDVDFTNNLLYGEYKEPAER